MWEEEAKEIIEKLLQAGWISDEIKAVERLNQTDFYGGEDFTFNLLESLLHELAHNLLLGDLTNPKNPVDTAKLISQQTTPVQDDDEVLTTAITIAILRDIYQTSDSPVLEALENVKFNTTSLCPHVSSDRYVLELSRQQSTQQSAREIVDYINSLD